MGFWGMVEYDTIRPPALIFKRSFKGSFMGSLKGPIRVPFKGTLSWTKEPKIPESGADFRARR